jgi:hypothetical protein
MPLVDLGHADDARIGERHWSVPIFLLQIAQGGQVFFNAECDLQRPIFEQPE